jgi:hypothetical protein
MLFACNPTIYKKPAEDFLQGTVSLRQAYFLEHDLSNKAMLERDDVETLTAIWASKKSFTPDQINENSETMVVNRQEYLTDFEDLRELRQKAFSTVEDYAGVLVSLASNEATEGIVTELNGLIEDTQQAIALAKNFETIVDYAKHLENLVGPLGQYVGVLNEIIRLVSEVVRTRAIQDTILKSDEAIKEVLEILKTEAELARENTRKQIQETQDHLLNKYMKTRLFSKADNKHKADIAKRLADLNTIEEQINNDDVKKAFDAAIEAQDALVKCALANDPTDWMSQIRSFRKRVELIRAAVEKANENM